MKRTVCTRILAALLAAAFAPVSGFCAEATLVYSHFANAGQLNPHLYSPNQMYAQEMVYEPLVALGPDNDIRPCLAESWEVSEDGRTYTFRLRTGVRFSDGEPFDAGAVEKNFAAIMANRGRHAWLELANRIAGFRAVDPGTFELTLTEPYYPTLADLSLPRPFRFISPAAIPESGTTADGILAPAGTGPWMRTESRLGVRDVFERNPLYRGEPPKLDRVVVKVIPDPMSRAMALETGEVDLVYGQGQISYDVFKVLAANPGFETAVSRPMGTVAAAINSAREPTDDIRVRRAVQHLVDKDAMVRGIILGTQPRADFLFSPDTPYCDVGLSPYRHDPAEAGRLLDEAGWRLEPGGRFRVRDGRELALEFCYIGNDPAHKAIAEVLQGQAARVGMRLILVGEEEDLFLRRQREGTFGMIMNPTWGPPFDPHAFLGSMRQPSHADFRAQSGLPMKAALDADITAALATIDEGERARLYGRILTTLHDQAVYLPIHYTCLFAAFRKGVVTGFAFGPGRTRYPFEILGKGR